jgi:hypothetical protein
MKRNIAMIVSGIVFSTNLIIGNSANAEEKIKPCNELAELIVDTVISFNMSSIDVAYSKPGIVSSDEYDFCLVSKFNELTKDYTIQVIKEDLEDGGTTYSVTKKKK